MAAKDGTGTIRVRVDLVLDVDVDDWRAEYGGTWSAAEVRESVKADIDAAARNVYPTSTYGTMVRVRSAER